MITENLAVLKINVYKTQEQYDREKEAGNINESEMHLTPEGEGVTKDELDEAIAKLSEEKADKAYVVSVFEELKQLILNGNIESAVAVLDKAILDLSTLA